MSVGGMVAWIGAAVAFAAALATNLAAVGKPIGAAIREAEARRGDRQLLKEIAATAKKTAGDTAVLAGSLSRLERRVDDNEADRLAEVIFCYGNLARRGHALNGEDFRFVQRVYEKYSSGLGRNGIVAEEYDYIKESYERGA